MQDRKILNYLLNLKRLLLMVPNEKWMDPTTLNLLKNL